MNEAISSLVVDLVEKVYNATLKIDPEWEQAFYRFHIEKSNHGSSGSVVSEDGVSIISALKPGSPLKLVNSYGTEIHRILAEQGHSFKVMLIKIGNDGSYNAYFDHNNSQRWVISKVDGNNGIPKEIPERTKKMLHQPKGALLRKVGLGLKLAGARLRRKF